MPTVATKAKHTEKGMPTVATKQAGNYGKHTEKGIFENLSNF